MPLGHHLQERRLHLCGCTVDLVGQKEVGHHGSEFGVELLTTLAIDTGTDEVRGHQVGGELHSREAATDDRRVRLDRKGLCHARHTFEQDVTAGQETDQDAFDQAVLTDDDPFDLEHRLLEQGDVGLRELEILCRGLAVVLR